MQSACRKRASAIDEDAWGNATGRNDVSVEGRLSEIANRAIPNGPGPVTVTVQLLL